MCFSTPNLNVETEEDDYLIATTITERTAGGFTSARNLKDLQDKFESQRMLATAKPTYQESRRLGTSTTAKKTKARAAGQGAITSFFGRPNSVLTAPALPPAEAAKAAALKRSHTTFVQHHTPLVDISNTAPPTSRSFPQSRPYQPPTLPNHRPRNMPMSAKPRKATPEPDGAGTRYVLLSSSPVKPESPAKQQQTYSDVEEVEQVDLTKESSTSFSSASGFRPASTFHTTSMSQVQNQAPAQRKTLGTRRTMQPWTVKNKAPPRPRPS
jgi:DNA helicase-2/ATP-dependent DNA helicase PcrA